MFYRKPEGNFCRPDDFTDDHAIVGNQWYKIHRPALGGADWIEVSGERFVIIY